MIGKKHVFLRVSARSGAELLSFLGVRGPMGAHGGPWGSMGVHGGPWGSMGVHGGQLETGPFLNNAIFNYAKLSNLTNNCMAGDGLKGTF